jgi:hypothetical protein
MPVSCIAGQHAVAPGEVRNQGFGFSNCLRCGCDMVRSTHDWQVVPRGFRVVWRHGPPRQTEISAAQLLFDLPAAGRSLTVPAGKKRVGPMGNLFLVLAGLRCLGWAAAGRLRSWRQALRAPRTSGLPMMQLAPAGPGDAAP